MTPEEVQACFTGPGGEFHFARWSVPVVPMIYGVEGAALPVLKGGLRLVADLTGQPLEEPAHDRAQNLLAVFVADWAELRGVAPLMQVFPAIEGLSHRLEAEAAGRYRAFRFGADGGIAHCLTLLRLTREEPADLMALELAVGASLVWAPAALAGGVSRAGQLRTELAGLLRAAYDPALPPAARDPAFAYRLAARMAR